jgi:DNA-binding GntR family transcriptional regulator
VARRSPEDAARWGRLNVFGLAGTGVPGRMEYGLADHGAILRAVLAGDEAAAREAAAAHVQRLKARVLADFFGQRA